MSLQLLAAKLALGPMLLPQARWVRRVALRLPEAPGAREGVVGAGDPLLRLLVIGDSSAAGVGLADQAQALALPLAQRLSEVIDGPVAWQLVAQSGVDSAQARAMVLAVFRFGHDFLLIFSGLGWHSKELSRSLAQEKSLSTKRVTRRRRIRRPGVSDRRR